MNAAETIQAAIEKIERLTVAAAYSEMNGWLVESNPVDDYGRYELAPVTNDELMVTLHRTIDAQLMILRRAQHWQNLFDQGRIPDAGDNDGNILARAILGETP